MKKKLLLMLSMALPIVAWCADGDTFTTSIGDGVQATFVVISESKKTCQLGEGNSNSSAFKQRNPEGTVYLPSTANGYSVIKISNWAFYRCYDLTRIYVPNSVTSIGNYAFNNCSSLVFIDIPNSVTSIGTGAFSYCNSLPSLTIPNSVFSIEAKTFENCVGLTSVVIPKSVTTITINAFDGCGNIESISVDTDNSVFDSRNNCNALIETLTNKLLLGCKNSFIPNTITSIGARAFQGCVGLNTINIPNSVLTIGNVAFGNCSNLTSISIPNSITNIGASTFAGCSSLESITIPSSINSIGTWAFQNCTSLRSVICYATSIPTCDYNPFDNCSSDLKFYVLADEVYNYRTSDWNWCNYTNTESIKLTTNDAGTSGGWCTYYNEGSNITVADGTAIYKATLNGAKTQVTLTKVDGNIIKAGEAVVLNTTSANIELSSAASSGSGDYTDNDLKGGSTVADGTTAYTLGMIGGQLGFYQYSGTALLDPYKAHLEIPATSASPLISISGTTGIDNIEKEVTGKESKWYDLSGRELQGKPMQKGIYLKYGKKYIVK